MSIAALAALGTTWAVIGSTGTVAAIDNVGPDPNVPVFGLDQSLIAVDAAGLFSPVPPLGSPPSPPSWVPITLVGCGLGRTSTGRSSRGGTAASVPRRT